MVVEGAAALGAVGEAVGERDRLAVVMVSYLVGAVEASAGQAGLAAQERMARCLRLRCVASQRRLGR